MNELAIEWIDKAEGDYATAGRELRARHRPNCDAVCFHAQQIAEKYLKAFLQEHGAAFPRTHSLIDLLELCLHIDGSFELQRNHLVLLDRYAVSYRYPGELADKTEARLAFKTVTTFRIFLREKLKTSEENDL